MSSSKSYEQSPNLPRLPPLVSVGPAPEIIFAFCRATVNAYLTRPVDFDFEDNFELTLIIDQDYSEHDRATVNTSGALI